MKRQETVLVLTRPIPGDEHFYSRWESVGRVVRRKSELVTIVALDHRTIVNEDFLSELPRLSWIVTPNTAHTHIETDLGSRGIRLVSLKGETEFLRHIHSVSEHVFRLLLSVMRPLNGMGHRLWGKTIGIIGHGRIGGHVSEIAQGFGMRVRSIDIDTPENIWREVFHESDVISVHLPESVDTRARVSRDLIDLMPKHSVLINTARGSVIDEEALRDALLDGRIYAAAVDVIEDHEVLNGGVPNLLISNHVGGSTIDDRILTEQFIIRKTRDLLHQSHSGR